MNLYADAELREDSRRHTEPRLADPSLERRFARDGYVIVRVMDADRARALANEVSALFDENPKPNQPLSNWYLGLIDPDHRLAVATARLTWEKVRPALAGLIAGARCHYTSIGIKPAGAGGTPIHQHWPSTVDPFARRIGCWVLLSSGSVGGATFRLAPGSHQLLPFIRHAHSGDYFEIFSDSVERDHTRDFVLEPGEAVLFEESILHGTAANDGDEMRVAAIASFIGSGMSTAVIQPDGGSAFSVIETGQGDAMETYLHSGRSDRRDRPVASIPNRNRQITEAEFVELIASQRKATLDVDPLDLIRNANERPAPRLSWLEYLKASLFRRKTLPGRSVG